MANILIIDDDKVLCDILSRQVGRMGHMAQSAHTLEEGYRRARADRFDVVFLDVGLPDGNGIEALPQIRGVPDSPEVIIFTGQGDPDGAELAIRSGAWDYIEKPPSIKQITLPLVRALQYREEKNKKPRAHLKADGIVGHSALMQSCLSLLAQAANSNMNVLITGETGTGKELFARGIHDNSDRADKPFVVVDCAALPDTLVESVLFGHEKGAFTGADRPHDGLVKQADKGTLFLDEVGELPLSLQKPFLRVLQERRFRPVGGRKELFSDFRLVAATNRSLDAMVDEGTFRSDLLFRLRSLTIELPALRQRPEDIKPIAVYTINTLCDRYSAGAKGFSPDFVEALEHHDWPGNVRELVNALETALVAASDEPTLFPNHLPTSIRVKLARDSLSGRTPAPDQPVGPAVAIPCADLSLDNVTTLKDYRDKAVARVEKQYLEQLMHLTDRDIKKACSLSGLSRSRLYFLLQKYELTSS